jgi:hypothetical protein
MPMSRNLRVALGATAAISALVLSSAAAAQATTAQTAKAAASASGASSIRSAAATPNFPTGTKHLWPVYSPGSWCLNATGYNQQANLENCNWQSTMWTITRLTPVDSRGGAWVQLQDQYYSYCLDAQDNATGSPNNNGDHVNSWPCDGASQQQWYLWPVANGHWMIVNHFNTNKVLDARTSGGWNPHIEGDPVQVWDSNGSAQQTWVINP